MQPQMQPPQAQLTRMKRVVVDSRGRNLQAYPDPNCYEVELPDDLHGVVAVRLLVADMPFPASLVGTSAASSQLGFQMASLPGQVLTAQLSSGDYTADQLAAEVADRMNDAAGAHTFVVTHDGTRFTFSATQPFTLEALPTGPLQRMLGLRAGMAHQASQYPAGGGSSGTTFQVVADFRSNLDPVPYVVMRMSPDAEVLMSPLQAVHRAFAVIPRRGHSKLNVYAEGEGTLSEKRWTPSLGCVARLRLEFTDPDGQLYDFQNQDHRIDLQFEILMQRRWQE